MEKYKGLVIEGGGARGIVYGGALQAMGKKGVLGNIIHYMGTSVGSITALMLVLGYTPQEIVIKTVNLRSDDILKKDFFFYINDAKNSENVFSIAKYIMLGLTIGLFRVPVNLIHLFFFENGYYDNAPLRKWIEKLLVDKGFDKDTSFKTIWEKTGKKLYITTTNWDREYVRVFSVDDDNVSVLDAVMISVSIPYFFRSVNIGGERYVDGGLVANYNIDYLSDNNIINAKDIIGLRVDDKSEIAGFNEGKLFKVKKKKKNFLQSLINTIDIMYAGANTPTLRGKHEQTTIRLSDHGIGVVDFSMNKEKKLYYSDLGYIDFSNKYKHQ